MSSLLLFRRRWSISRPRRPRCRLDESCRVGDLLQLSQNEIRNNEGSADKARLRDVGDTAVDDDRRVEDLVIAFDVLVAEDAAECREVEVIALRRTDHQPNVAHKKCQHDGQK